MNDRPQIEVRNTTAADFPQIAELSRRIYPDNPPWKESQLASHLQVFPEGQLVAVDRGTGQVVGMAASLIVLWDDYDAGTSWRDFTEMGTFANHDPENGHTLYGAEVMVHPDYQGKGVGSKLYAARRELAKRLGLWRIRAGARLRGYHRYSSSLSPEGYVEKVKRDEIRDPTLSFQLHRGFKVLTVVQGYLSQDHESLGHAAVIEWINPDAHPDEQVSAKGAAGAGPA
ncbi:MAG TPA: GNAT family N-acetyltransferase [Vicinamibacterales bacterium]|nr:GNAT family N-acetyltransferase [Vicinamibacterales bacterium]